MTLFEGNLPQTDRERDRKRKRASETAGNRGPQIEFPSSVLPVVWMCTTVFAWFTPSLMNCRVWSQVIVFGPYRFTVFRAHFWQKTPAILKWSSTILTVTHVIYIWYWLNIKWMNWCAPFLDNPIEYVLAFICVCVVKHWGAPLLFHQTKKSASSESSGSKMFKITVWHRG